MSKKNWYKLDNIGIFYSSLINNKIPNVFRYSVTLTENIDKDILQNALNSTILEYPNFNVRLRSGFFWHYLESIKKPNRVSIENLPICFGLNNSNDGYLYRVSFYRNRVNLEVSHILSDGRGSLNFLKTLIYNYLGIKYSLDEFDVINDGSLYQKVEDSFDKYYTKVKNKTSKHVKVYKYKEKRIKNYDNTYFEYHLPADKVLEIAHTYDVSLTVLLISVLINSIKDEMKERDLNKAIKVSIPVDLRSFFKSTTTRNFFGMTSVSYKFNSSNDTLEDIISSVNKQLKDNVTKDNLKIRMNKMIALEKNPIIKIVPVFIKDIAIRLSDKITTGDSTTCLSNIGLIKVDKRLEKYIVNFNAIITTNSFKMTICSYMNDLSISYSSAFYNNNIMKSFCRFFSNNDINGVINTNKEIM